MEDYIKLSNTLEELRIDILNYKNSDDEKQDLMDKFFEVKQVSPETYELLILIYNEFNMTNKTDKKQMIYLLDKALSIKTNTVNKLIREKDQFVSWPQKISELMTWQNAKRLMIFWVIFVAILFTIYKIDPNAYLAIEQSFGKVITETASVIKEKKE